MGTRLVRHRGLGGDKSKLEAATAEQRRRERPFRPGGPRRGAIARSLPYQRRAMSWLIPRNELTPDQIRAIEFSPTEHRAILGGPGSGKTQILLHRAAISPTSSALPPSASRIFVYTNVLKDYIKSALSLLNLPDDAVLTFDHWCHLFYQQHVNSRLPWNATKKQPDFDAVRRAVLDKISSGKISLPLYD